MAAVTLADPHGLAGVTHLICVLACHTTLLVAFLLVVAVVVVSPLRRGHTCRCGSSKVTFSLRMADSVAVVFAGQCRGTTDTWASLRDRLIRPNNADVYAYFWRSPSVACFVRVMKSKSRVLARAGVVDVRELEQVQRPWSKHVALFFGRLNNTIDLREAPGLAHDRRREQSKPGEKAPSIGHYSTAEHWAQHILTHYGELSGYPWLQYYLVQKAFGLVANTGHSTLVRVRSDALFHVDPVPLTRLYLQNAVHLEPGKWESSEAERSRYFSLERGGPWNSNATWMTLNNRSASCGYMPNDWYATASYLPTRQRTECHTTRHTTCRLTGRRNSRFMITPQASSACACTSHIDV